MRAIQITEFGGPEVLQLTDLPAPVPVDGQVLIDVSRAGVNYADTHQAENSYLAPATLPLVPGAEVVGRTADGRRVVALLEGGGYAQQAVAWETLTFDVPDAVSDGQALALVLQGTTAWHLLRTSSHLAPGETVVVHAAAGGVGTLAVQLAKAWGAGRVIATASSQAKRDLAIELGADVAVDPEPDGLKDRLREANGGRGVDVVLEMTGGPVFDASLSALAPFGRLVVYGMASRQQPSGEERNRRYEQHLPIKKPRPLVEAGGGVGAERKRGKDGHREQAKKSGDPRQEGAGTGGGHEDTCLYYRLKVRRQGGFAQSLRP